MIRLKKATIEVVALFTFLSLFNFEKLIYALTGVSNLSIISITNYGIYLWKIFLFLYLFYCKRKILFRQPAWIILLVCYFLVGTFSMLREDALISVVIDMWIYYFTDVLPVVVTIIYIGDISRVLDALCKVAYINLPYVLLFPFTDGYYQSGAYMSYGYGTIFLLGCILFKMKKSIWDIAYSVVWILLLFFYGNRGIVVCLTALVILHVIFFTSIRRKPGYIMGIIVLGGNLIAYWEKIVIQFSLFLSKFGIYSRTLDRLISGTYTISYGRTILYETIWDKIRNNLWGYGLGYDRIVAESVDQGKTYAHSVFLELWLDFGLLLGSILLSFIVLVVIKLVSSKKYSVEYRKWNAIFGGMGLAQLLLSQSIFTSMTVLTALTISVIRCDKIKYRDDYVKLDYKII